VSTDSGFEVEERERLFDASRYSPDWGTYDVFPGDDAFVALAPGPGGASDVDDLVLVQNLFELLDRRAPN
jgi:hypothetical protein